MKYLIILIILVLILLIKLVLIQKKIYYYNKNSLKNLDDTDLKLMIGYNYIVNLNKLESIINELNNTLNISKEKIDYMEKIIDNTNNSIYNNNIKEKTIYYENEYLYKTTIINLDIIFYALKFIFKQIKKNNYNYLDKEINIINKKNFNKKIYKLSKKSNKILNKRKHKRDYYYKINKIKNEYRKLIDNSNPILLISFIKECIQKINESC